MTTKPRLIGGVFLYPLFSATPKAKAITSGKALKPQSKTPPAAALISYDKANYANYAKNKP
jgi:hypothetical protein